MHDVVIVGAGTAGCVLAARLSEDPTVRVLLLEAGARDSKREIEVPAAFSKLFDSEVDWGYRTVPQRGLDGRNVFFPRGRVLGGSASINAMMALRGHRSDHERWPTGWQWEDVEAAYRLSGEAIAVGTPTDANPLTHAFIDAAASLGIPRRSDLNEPDNDGVGLTPLSVRRGRRWSVVDAYLRPALKRPNLDLQLGAHAVRVIFEAGRAVGVSVTTPDGVRIVKGREVVVAAGAIGSPVLLQRSGIGDASKLAPLGIEVVADRPGVGANLGDHLANGVIVATNPGVETLTTAERFRHVLRWLLTHRGPLTSNVAEAAAFVRSEPGLVAPDIELVFAPVPFTDEGLTQPTFDGFTIAAVLLQPRSVGSVTLRSPEPHAPPLIDPGFLTDREGHDLSMLRYGVRLARRVATSPPLAQFAMEERLPGAEVVDDEGITAHIRAVSQTLYHPVGTCRMGTDAASVVDPELRVRGVEGLRVVDASVIPSPPRGHTNWPTAMVAERAASMLRGWA
jgi:choline dehydrogenase